VGIGSQAASLGAIIASALALLTGGAAQAACRDDAVQLRGDFGQARFRVEVADDDGERARGLMFREKLSAGSGMLFVYPSPQTASFWMKNTLIPLDMIFVDRAGIVRAVHSNARPLDETPIYGGEGILAVLEINGGLAQSMGIGPGAHLRHPAIPHDGAAWRCDE
jgi:uncharacterized membrane protein (UPF0127 family)